MPPFDLQRGEVHVWSVDLDASPFALATYRSLLAPDESERAERLRFEHLRVRFIAARGILRQLLGGCLQVAPEQLVFRYGPYGKPELAAPAAAGPGGSTVAFNLAHSHNLAVYALAFAPRLGVDVEQVREVLERDQIAERFFSPRERQSLAALPPGLRDEAFFLCWTRKEAYLKALGAGITFPLDRFSVSLVPGAPAALLEPAEGEGAESPWTLLPFTPAPGFHGAVAVEGSEWVLRCQQWSGDA